MDLCFYVGPVSASDLAAVEWHRPTELLVVNHRDWPGALQGEIGPATVGSGAFAALAARLGSRPLSAALAAVGKSLSDYERVCIVSFSAGHGFCEAVFRSDDAASVNAFLSADSYFTNLENRSAKPGYLSYFQRAIAGDCLAVHTSSDFAGPGYPSDDASFANLAALLSLTPEDPPAGVPPPVSCVGAGNFVWADYGTTVFHADHVHKLAVPWINSVLAPYLAGEKPDLALASAPGGGRLWRVVKAAGAALLIAGTAYVAFDLAKGRRSNPARSKNPPKKTYNLLHWTRDEGLLVVDQYEGFSRAMAAGKRYLKDHPGERVEVEEVGRVGGRAVTRAA